MDKEIRDAERAAFEGGFEEQVRLLKMKVRSGLVLPEHVFLAASLGDPVAIATGIKVEDPLPLPFSVYGMLHGLENDEVIESWLVDWVTWKKETANWSLRRKIIFGALDPRVLLAVFADTGEQLLPILEKAVPEETRPRELLLIIREWLETANDAIIPPGSSVETIPSFIPYEALPDVYHIPLEEGEYSLVSDRPTYNYDIVYLFFNTLEHYLDSVSFRCPDSIEAGVKGLVEKLVQLEEGLFQLSLGRPQMILHRQIVIDYLLGWRKIPEIPEAMYLTRICHSCNDRVDRLNSCRCSKCYEYFCYSCINDNTDPPYYARCKECDPPEIVQEIYEPEDVEDNEDEDLSISDLLDDDDDDDE